ncbi:tRNA 2-thiouridine(34) synthase MnmA [Hippea alviniae]|uniref:tRNA 2-thiouridine(34) synthase MnmA n=1 Tax=Hippea alviniae TaxID=1279027 RepID=UPI0003B49BE9|nr:tRNA 2-thiouridine(34) synthase MnmA [Hippea alviniae]
MRVLVGLSGGVDSAVAAYLLKEEGYEVVGITLKLYDNESSIKDAKLTAESLDIEWHLFDYSDYFKKTIVDYFFRSYLDAKTPSPCLFCNRKVKFKLLYDKAKELNCNFVATGHYARVEEIGSKKVIAKSISIKDQSYFLALLRPSQIERTVFPLGNMEKDRIREIAEKLNLPVAEKKESLDVCFIDGDYRDYLKRLYPNREGYFILNGKRIKKHDGIFNYTIGQRKGLRIPYKEALYVRKIDVNSLNIYLTTKSKMFKRKVKAKLINLVYLPSFEFEAKAKLRSKMSEADCTVKLKKSILHITFNEPQFAPTPGQIAAIYYKNAVIMAGVIL